ncbi:unnamed protein product [Timema podura]|uniref:Uncharacterized protein n=1 Tax=Timema podura TaxID=61482 RepID=A0ABN7P5S1_TIMPD|nr:unnamed protein product [Timema podura]
MYTNGTVVLFSLENISYGTLEPFELAPISVAKSLSPSSPSSLPTIGKIWLTSATETFHSWSGLLRGANNCPVRAQTRNISHLEQCSWSGTVTKCYDLFQEHEEVKSKPNLSQENNPDNGTALNILNPGQIRSTVHLVEKPPLEDYNPHLERHVDHPTK